MRIMIVGAGAVGGFLASVLHESGHVVSVVARGPHLSAIQHNGLRVLTHDGRASVEHLDAHAAPRAPGAHGGS